MATVNDGNGQLIPSSDPIAGEAGKLTTDTALSPSAKA
jgi:hypothetical protein